MVGCIGERNLNSEASHVKHFQLFCSFKVSKVSGIDRYKITKQSWVDERPSTREFWICLTRSKLPHLLCVGICQQLRFCSANTSNFERDTISLYPCFGLTLPFQEFAVNAVEHFLFPNRLHMAISKQLWT